MSRLGCGLTQCTVLVLFQCMSQIEAHADADHRAEDPVLKGPMCLKATFSGLSRDGGRSLRDSIQVRVLTTDLCGVLP